MRLVCPNCAAQYEVDASAIPEDGRDVQCANCGNTWFQPPEAGEPEEAVAPVVEPDDLDDLDEEQDGDEPVQDPPLTRPPATPVDQSVLDILRQEAELDATTRQAEPETEPEPVPEPEPEPAEPSLAERAAQNRLSARRDRDMRVNPAPPAEAGYGEVTPEPEYAPAPQRAQAPEQALEPGDLGLPDVDALNSTLRPADDKGRAREEKRGRAKKPGKRGNSFGFYLAVLIFLVLLAAYALRAQIIDAVPASEPYLIQYAVLVDAARVQVESGMLALIEAVKNLIARFV
ncbi:MAG: hypothetical protein GXP03_06810 [Alphaproteobacteria bacterium]|nr:hypothetical protein [Alphaproteobacteria bacterium]